MLPEKPPSHGKWHYILMCIGIGLFIACATVSGASDKGITGTGVQGNSLLNTNPTNAGISITSLELPRPWVMNFTDEQIAINNFYYNSEKVYTGPQFPIYPESRNLLGHIDYIPEERNQNYINNCWIWACTAALEAALDVQNGVKQRLSIQYFDSNYMGGSAWGFNGGNAQWFADFYNETGTAIPWSNLNADYQDGPHHVTVEATNKAYVDKQDIQTSPSYGIYSISVEKVLTVDADHPVDQSSAIYNIKTAINNDHPVIFSLTFPNKEKSDEFDDMWYRHPESYPLDIGAWDQAEINYTEKDSHEMLVVGYEGDEWIVLNSYPAGWWNGEKPDGTPIHQYIDRPHNLFRLKMNLDYSKAWGPQSPSGEWQGCGDACDNNIYLTTWQVLNVTFAEKLPLHPSLALDQNGKPHIAYFNRTGALLYASWENNRPVGTRPGLEQPGSWNIATVYSGGYPGSRYCSLAFDRKGIPHISFAEFYGKNLKYASLTRAGSAGPWNIETVCHSNDGIGDNSLVMTFNGPTISYYDYSTRSLDYATRTTQGWQTKVVDGDSDVGWGNSLKTNIIDVPAISYTDTTRGALRFAQFLIPSQPKVIPHWQISTIDGIDTSTPNPTSTHVGKYPSLAFESVGKPAITYYAEGSQNLKYAKFDGKQWKIQNAIPITNVALQGTFNSLALATGNNPSFSFYEELNKDLVYAEKRVKGGVTTPQPGLDLSMAKVDTQGDVGRYSSLALSRVNIPYIAYYDATNRAVKCAWKAPSGWQITRVGQ